ncbi:glycosyltransferase family 4 protein [Sporolactobacillus sp. STSJ-5]|uniref:glycosyltransferase family 4 protein n=1 Tax=Sporolactobacillus sp. STSJ-5 TaxID=2965076 RepID=UPI002103A073|nr:glycosyltransferase family 4 protein [Sporolactobacillus sp. STSJ-5]MCQ2009526.1 glycosyltransferase family 4 protein [Sporolactobacillus sp. STSJ-5]
MKIAIVHEWFVSYAGSEKVVEQLINVFPEADLFSIVDFMPPEKRGFLHGKKVTTSFIQKLPFAKKKFRNYLSLMPLAVEQFDLSDYDIIISSSHAVAKGVITGPDQIHISYVHSPIRYAWDLQWQYLKESNLENGLKSWIVRYILHKIRLWDSRTANGVDFFVANSKYIGRRIWKIYRRKSEVIYPPVDIESFPLQVNKKNFYVTASRIVPYKKVETIVEAFNEMPDKRLVVIGDGPGYERVKNLAKPNIEIMGYQDFSVLKSYLQEAKAFIFASEEDFGITPVEAQACGTPVIAYGRGGALESVRSIDGERPTGIFFDKQTPDAIISAVKKFEELIDVFDPLMCRKNAERFTVQKFRNRIKTYIESKIEAQ